MIASNQLSKQFSDLRDTIGANIGIIKALVQQADSLNKLAESISGDEDKKELLEVKAKIEEQCSAINDQLNQLITQTERLMELYIKTADILFKKE